MTDSKKNFLENGYCIVRSAISSEIRDFVTQYALFDEMRGDPAEDPQVPNSHSKYSDPAMESMLLHLQPIMEEHTGISLFPTYSYYRVYRNGDELFPHTDRESCEISATLCFNYNYDSQVFSWPIYMDGNKVVLNPGDLVIYKGCELTHWREKLNHEEEIWHVQGFFHYVDVNGPYKSFKYDKREHVGQITKNKNSNVQAEKSYIKYF